MAAMDLVPEAYASSVTASRMAIEAACAAR
jgi:hypothetical protein